MPISALRNAGPGRLTAGLVCPTPVDPAEIPIIATASFGQIPAISVLPDRFIFRHPIMASRRCDAIWVHTPALCGGETRSYLSGWVITRRCGNIQPRQTRRPGG